MSSSAVRSLQSTIFIGNLDKQANSKETVKTTLEEHKEKVDASYKSSLVEIEKDLEAAKTQSFWTKIGCIFGGPILGSMLGKAIGGAVNDDDQEAAGKAKVAVGKFDMDAQKAMDAFGEATKDLHAAKQDANGIAKFHEELNDNAMVGTTR